MEVYVNPEECSRQGPGCAWSRFRQGESWVGLKTHLGSPFWLEPGEKVARDEGGVAAGHQGKGHRMAIFFSS